MRNAEKIQKCQNKVEEASLSTQGSRSVFSNGNIVTFQGNEVFPGQDDCKPCEMFGAFDLQT